MAIAGSIGALEILELPIQCMTLAGVAAAVWAYWIRPARTADAGEMIVKWGAEGFVIGLGLELISELT